MWKPKDEAEIVTVVNQGALKETTTFEAKRQVSTDNTEIAKDIAAMTNDGGVICYGIGEDTNKRLTVLSPVELAGQPERITSIARTAISEPPVIHVHTFPTAADPTKGYIVVEVPPSPRAPHMVMVKKDRFYGRTSAGNYHLTEGEVARLYARRQQTEVDRDIILQQEMRRYPFEPDSELAYLYAFVRPVFPQTDDLLERARPQGYSVEETLYHLVHASKKKQPPRTYPSQMITDPTRWEPTVDGYRGDIVWGRGGNQRDMLRLEIEHHGAGHLFCGRVAHKTGNEDILWFEPDTVAVCITQFLYLYGLFYGMAEYHGQVDIGVAVTGLKGCLPIVGRTRWSEDWPPYEQDEYRRTARHFPHELLNNKPIAEKLVMPLIRAITQGLSNPFSS